VEGASSYLRQEGHFSAKSAKGHFCYRTRTLKVAYFFDPSNFNLILLSPNFIAPIDETMAVINETIHITTLIAPQLFVLTIVIN
jgi:hypothetical protein